MVRVIALLVVTACQATPGMPWLHGLEDVVSSTGIAEPRAPADPEIDENCGVAASRTIELVADVAPSSGRETIVASYSGGITVFDREDHVVSETPGYRCTGSADELEVVAAGNAYGDRLLVISAISGGRNEAATWVGLFRTGATLDPVFAGVVDLRTGDDHATGALHLLPGGLLHQSPGARLVLWRLDPASKIYVPVLTEEPHAEPPLVSSR